MQSRPWQRHYDWNVPETIRYPRLMAHELLGVSVNAFPDKPATHFFGSELTFWELRNQILRMAHALGEAGVRKGDRVGVQLPNCPQYIISYYAALYLGAIVVNLNPMYTVDELKGLTTNTAVSTLITFDMVLSNIRALCQEVEIARVIVTRVTDYIDGFGQSTPAELELEEGWLHFSTMLEASTSTTLPKVDISVNDPALIQFTGGTTGLPKVADAVSVGVPDEYRGETVKAFVVVKPGETVTSEEIIEFCREKLAAYKAPKIIEFREELPKSAVGKILRKVLRKEELDKAEKK